MSRPDMNRFGSAVEWARQGSRGDERIILEMAEEIHNYIYKLERVVEAAKEWKSTHLVIDEILIYEALEKLEE